jgi:hypothetical protein
MPSVVNRMPPTIWNAGTVMPKNEKIARPRARTASVPPAAAAAFRAERRRASGVQPVVRPTKIGADAMGLMIEKSDENARSA